MSAVTAQNRPMNPTPSISAAALFCALLTQDRLNLPDAGPVRLRALRSSDLRAFLAYPVLTLKVMVGIHWEALKLWLKGVQFHSRPQPPSAGVS